MTPTDTIGDDVRLYRGDCLAVLASMADASVDCIITDPPFSSRTHRGHDASASVHQGFGKDGATRKALGYEAWSDADVKTFVPEFVRVCTGWIVVMTDHVLAPSIASRLEECGRYVFAPLPFFAPGSRVRLSGDGPSSWTIWIVVARTAKQLRWGTLPGGYLAGEGWRDREHMGGKPVKLMRAIVGDYSRSGDTVLDPFMGAGTTPLAAVREGRKAIGVELDSTHYATALRRLTHATGAGPGQLFGALEGAAS